MGSETRRPLRRGRRSRISAVEVLDSTRWITPRDRNICIDLRRHHVLTVHQLTDLHFPTARKARERLLELTQREVLLRFRPQRNSGSAPFHYVLGELGAHIVAGYFGLDVGRVIAGLEEEDWQLAHSAKLPHLLDTHDFFIALIKACRAVSGYRLTRWWSEKRWEREWRDDGYEPLIRPDAQGILVGPSGEAAFLLEVDRERSAGAGSASGCKAMSTSQASWNCIPASIRTGHASCCSCFRARGESSPPGRSSGVSGGFTSPPAIEDSTKPIPSAPTGRWLV